MRAESRLPIAGNTSRSGKNKVTEIGNVVRTCGIQTCLLRHPQLHNKNKRLAVVEFFCTLKRSRASRKTDSMNWEMITAIGQMAAVCVGIPSVIYFAVQLREQTRERRQAAVNALTVQWGELTKALHENAEFTAVYLHGVQSFHDLDPVSKLRFSAFQN